LSATRAVPGHQRREAVRIPDRRRDALVVRFEPAGPNGLKESNNFGATWTLQFDGPSAPMTGPTSIANMMIAGKIIDDYTISTIRTREGVIVARATWKVSADGKTLTNEAVQSTTRGMKRRAWQCIRSSKNFEFLGGVTETSGGAFIRATTSAWCRWPGIAYVANHV
jgi:hypothetical protein